MSNQLARKAPPNDIQEFFQANRDRLAQVCGKHLTPERVIQLAVLCTFRTPKLAECDRGSLLASVVQASSLGLDLSPSAGEAYLIPRWNKDAGVNECQFQIGYQGITKLVRNTGQVPFVQARLVHRRDVFTVAYEDARTIFRHEPCLDGDPGPPTHVYAVAKLAAGDHMIEIMTRADVESIRARAKSPDKGPWATDWGEMAKKTVLRRLCKSLPKSAELVAAMEAHDADFEMGTFDGPLKALPPQNHSGHGRGQYASPERAAKLREEMVERLDQRNAAWIDKWTDDVTGEVPPGVKEVMNLWQLDNHMVKWGIETGRLDPACVPDERGQKNRQICCYTAIIVDRSKEDRRAFWDEVVRYWNQQVERQTEALRRAHPHLFGDDGESADGGADAPGEGDADADDAPDDAWPAGRE